MLSTAQVQKPKAQAKDKLEVFAGYTLSRSYGDPNVYNVSTSGDEFAAFNLNGGQAAVSYFPARNFGITYEMTFLSTGSRASSVAGVTETTNTQDYLVGPTFRYALKNDRLKGVTLFAHQLFGASRESFNFALVSDSDVGCKSQGASCSGNAFTMATGAGLDVKIGSHLSLRPAQLEYWTRQTSANVIAGGDWNESLKWGADGFRYSGGAVIRF